MAYWQVEERRQKEEARSSLVVTPQQAAREAEADARALLDVWCEVIDNQLAAIAQARRKLLAIQQISAALKEPVLDVGIDRAIDVLRDSYNFV